MEIACVRAPCFAVKGQGGRILFLTLTALLWTLGGCQLDSSDPSPSPQPAVTQLPSTFIQTSFAAEIQPTSDLLTADLETDISTSSVISLAAGSFPEGSETSVFVGSSVTFFSTESYSSVETSPRLSDFYVTRSFLASSDTADNVVSRTDGLTIASTSFLDSVAASLRWNPADENLVWTASGSPLQTFASVDLGASAPDEHTSTELVVSTETWSVSDLLSPSPSNNQGFPSTELYTDPSSVFVSTLPTSSEMLDINSTQSAGSFHSVAGETTSPLMSSAAVVTSPGASGGNASCADTDAGCVVAEEGGEDGRIKIIVGVACGAILLVVLVGVVVGCLLRRRGKMTSGSKVDLSSYWDDSVTLSYINGHIDIPKDSADEMVSLDNDSFLNSLDSMSFTNTWTSDTSTSKHTNF
ncbi:uncharacterized protein [Littorina saxatilis]|uniref:Uncharacterized protein n=1 Tax=Littorina saxatilis TaxID=31220 RepID=A0AAN9G0X1_9CAEN